MRHPDEKVEYGVSETGLDRPHALPLSRRLLSLWRHKWGALLCIMAMTVLGIAYIANRAPTYTANGLLLVENTTLDPGRQELVPSMGVVDTSLVESQIEIIKSDAIALKVIEELNLSDDTPPGALQSWIAALKDIFPGSVSSEPADASQALRAALPGYSRSLSVRRIGTTYLIDVRFMADRPDLAAEVTNKVIEAYLAHQEEVGAAAAATASAWLRERIKDLGPKARLISSASPPLKPDGPGRLVLLGSFMGLGVLAGLGFAVARSVLDKTLRDPMEAELKLGVSCLGAVAKSSSAPQPQTAATSAAVGREAPATLPAGLRRSLDAPYSDIGISVTRIRAALARSSSPAIIGVTSTVEGEGTTTLAANLAVSAAAAGSRVLLVDGNANKPDLTQRLGGDARRMPIDIASPAARPSQVAGTGHQRLDFMPLKGLNMTDQSSHSRAQLATLVRSWRAEYDLVIIDLPPLLPAADVAFTRSFVDAFLLVIQWGHTPEQLTRNALEAAGLSGDDLLGFVLNKVKPSAFNRTIFPIEAYARHRRDAKPVGNDAPRTPEAPQQLSASPIRPTGT